MDILSLKRQYANLDLFEQSTLSNSAEDLSQLERHPYQFEIFGQDQNDIDDGKFKYTNINLYIFLIQMIFHMMMVMVMIIQLLFKND